jgi:hypothetical protein
VRVVGGDRRLRHLDEDERVGRAAGDVADANSLVRGHRREGNRNEQRASGDGEADERRASVQES